MTVAELESRVAALEKQVRLLSAQTNTNQSKKKPTKNWLLKNWGAFADDPDFDKAAAFGKKWRESENRKASNRNGRKKHK